MGETHYGYRFASLLLSHQVEITEDSVEEIANRAAQIDPQTDDLTADGIEIVATILEDISLVGSTNLKVINRVFFIADHKVMYHKQ